MTGKQQIAAWKSALAANARQQRAGRAKRKPAPLRAGMVRKPPPDPPPSTPGRPGGGPP